MHIGHSIRIFRLQQQLTQEQLALDVNIATSNISRIENGLRQPSHRLLLRLADSLKTTPAALYAACDLLPDPVTADRMIHESDTSVEHAKTSAGLAASAELQTLLKLFSELDSENQILLLEQAKLLRKWQKNNR